MKHNRFILALALLLPFAAMAQTAETDTGRTALPEAVKTLVFNDCNALIVPDSRSSYETGKMPNGAEVNVSGSVSTPSMPTAWWCPSPMSRASTPIAA